MYVRTSEGLGQPQPICQAAIGDLDRLQRSLKLFNKALTKKYVDSKRLKNLVALVGSDVDRIIGNLDAYIDGGCSAPELKTLEVQVRALPWTFQRTSGSKIVRVERFRGIEGAYRQLIDAIKVTLRKARS